MNKKVLLFFIILTVGVLYTFNIERVIQKKLSILNKSVQSTYFDIYNSINNIILTYIYQIDYINQLEKSNKILQKYKILYDTTFNKLEELDRNINILNFHTLDLPLEKVKVVSYYKFNDYSRVLIDKNDLDNSKIYSLITLDGYSAGIVVNKNNTSVAYLNENKRCNYTVFIGKENAPGITSGVNNDGKIVIKYVPIWKKISLGDEVITSSMDNIFPFGIKVGKVINIDIQDNIQELLVSPYAKTLGNRDYYLYDNSHLTQTLNK
ncbi:MAG: hypothetical protein CSA86_03740 [Arcobacter sp.]|nr:MAG: hypothetical protein CSA86_03740 [Arcobacter sp.]